MVAVEFADVPQVYTKMKGGNWPTWNLIAKPTDVIMGHPWYQYGRVPSILEYFNLEIMTSPTMAALALPVTVVLVSDMTMGTGDGMGRGRGRGRGRGKGKVLQ